MTRLSAKIIKLSGVNVVSSNLNTITAHRKDLTRRLKSQRKALTQSVDRGWLDCVSIIQRSVEGIEKTLAVLDQLEEKI